MGGNDVCGITDTMPGGGSITRATDPRGHHSSSLYSNNIMSTATASDGNRMMSGINPTGTMPHLKTSGRNSQEQHFRGHTVRLNSIEPNTVMFNTKVRRTAKTIYNLF